ncbi:MAG: M3 family oligoendopeptidase, partial [Bauldia litoralis]
MTQTNLDKNTDAGAAGAEPLPTWNLADLYPGRESKELNRDLDRIEADAKRFRDRYAGAVADLSGDDLADAIAAFEAMSETIGRIMSFASLEYAGNISDPATGRFFQSMQERVNTISAQLIFFTLDINQIDEDALAARMTDSAALAHYAPWLRDTRAFRDHELSDEMERLLHEKEVAGRAAWSRLFDETIAGLRFDVGGKDLTEAETLNLLSDSDRAKREAAGRALGAVFGKNARLFAHITNTLAKDKEIDDRWRNFKRPVSSRNLANHVEDEVVDALVSSVRAAYPKLSHRYYAMKAKWLGLDTLRFWDRNAPLPDSDDKTIPWEAAQETVLSAYRRFTPALAELGTRFFDQGWIDAQVRPGKASGAFSHPTVPSAHPYILLNYQGRVRDVMTLAHELGHGVHQLLAAKQGALMANTPLTLAETASVFGEMLTFRSMLDAESDPKRRRVMLAGKIEDMLNTVVR